MILFNFIGTLIVINKNLIFIIGILIYFFEYIIYKNHNFII
jgi:hypothetical protein